MKKMKQFMVMALAVSMMVSQPATAVLAASVDCINEVLSENENEETKASEVTESDEYELLNDEANKTDSDSDIKEGSEDVAVVEVEDTDSTEDTDVTPAKEVPSTQDEENVEDKKEIEILDEDVNPVSQDEDKDKEIEADLDNETSVVNDIIISNEEEEVISAKASKISGTNVSWKVSGSTLVLSGKGAIPDYWWSGGVPWYSQKDNITSISIGSGITKIGSGAFKDFSNLVSVRIPKNVTAIGDNAFNNCPNLITVTFNSGSRLKTIGSGAFRYCVNILSISIPNSVVSLDTSCFDGCINLTKVVIGKKVKSIPYCAFDGCTNLTKLTLGASVTSIEAYAFRGNGNLTGVTIPAKCTKIEEGAFVNDRSLRSLVFAKGSKLTYIGTNAFNNCTALKTVTFPARLSKIDGNAFRECTALKNISFQSGSKLTEMGGYVFAYCNSLVSINLPARLSAVSYACFYNCKNLKKVTLGKNITSIDSYAFEECPSLTGITIPAACTVIGYEAFKDDTSLTTLKFASGSKLTKIDYGAFQYTALTGKLALPSKVVSVENGAFYKTNLSGVTFNKNCNTIGSYAFADCLNLSYVKFGSSLNKIENSAFENTSLTSVVIPNSVLTIESGAFNNVKSLYTVKIGTGIQNINYHAFGNCTGLNKVYIYSRTVSFDNAAFYDVPGFTLYGFSGSTVQKFANNNGISFVAITQKNISKTGFSLVKTSYTFSGRSFAPEVRNTKGLVEGLDYTVIYDSSSKTGKHTVSIYGRSGYKGAFTLSYNVSARNIKDTKVSLSYSKKTYTGKALKPSVIIKVGSRRISSYNYTVKYSNNVKVGKATVTITGRRGLKGTIKKTFDIVKKK